MLATRAQTRIAGLEQPGAGLRVIAQRERRGVDAEHRRPHAYDPRGAVGVATEQVQTELAECRLGLPHGVGGEQKHRGETAVAHGAPSRRSGPASIRETRAIVSATTRHPMPT